jgi:hypothetical protein
MAVKIILIGDYPLPDESHMRKFNKSHTSREREREIDRDREGNMLSNRCYIYS